MKPRCAFRPLFVVRVSPLYRAASCGRSRSNDAIYKYLVSPVFSLTIIRDVYIVCEISSLFVSAHFFVIVSTARPKREHHHVLVLRKSYNKKNYNGLMFVVICHNAASVIAVSKVFLVFFWVLWSVHLAKFKRLSARESYLCIYTRMMVR